MRLMIIAALALGPSAGFALAQVTPTTPAAPGSLPKTSQTISAEQKSTQDAAVADCERMWDRGTHMTKQEWSRTCRRVQNRLQQIQVK
jgi:hypothetical protein